MRPQRGREPARRVGRFEELGRWGAARRDHAAAERHRVDPGGGLGLKWQTSTYGWSEATASPSRAERSAASKDTPGPDREGPL